MAKSTKYIIGFLTLVILTASIYIMLPESVRIDVTGTKTTFKVWENNSWVLAGTEYTKIYDGTTLMRAESREVNYSIEGNKTIIQRISKYKGNLIVYDNYEFDGSTKDVELFPVKHEIVVINGQKKTLQYEANDLMYTGETENGIESPQQFGHKMKIEWEEGNYYSQIFKYKNKDIGKITIKYKIETDNFSKEVRLFDPSTFTQISSTYTRWASIAIGSDGILHVAAFKGSSAYDLGYCNNSGGSWSCVSLATTLTSASDSGSGADIAVDSSNKVHIAFRNNTGDDLGYCTNAAGSWACETVDEEAANTGVYPSIAIDLSDKVHITHQEATDEAQRYCTNAGGSWACQEVFNHANRYRVPNAIAINSTGAVYILFEDNHAGDLSYIYSVNNGASWSSVLDVINQASYYDYEGAGMAIDTNGKLHVVYDDDANDDLRYCTNAAGSFTCTTIESVGDVGNGPDIALDSNNYVHITHGDATNGDLRYCNNIKGWRCKVAFVSTSPSYVSAGGHGLAIKKGVLASSSSFDATANYVFYYLNLYYLNQTFLPLPDLIYPAYGDTTYGETVDLNFSISNSTALSKCLYTLDNYATNTTITNCRNTTMTIASAGSKTVKLWANDSTGGWNDDLVTFTAIIDETPPTYSSPGHSSTKPAESTTFSLLVNDDTALEAAGYFIFSTNNTGRWVNDSNVLFTATPEWANVTKTLNSTPGTGVGYRWFLYDNAGNANQTPIYTLTVSDYNYTMSILDPTTASPESVSDGDNITMTFLFLNSGNNVTTGLTINDVFIGGQEATILETSTPPDSTPSSCGNDCSGGDYTYSSTPSCTDYILADACAGASSCDGTDTVVDIWLNGTSFLEGDSVNVTMQTMCYGSTDEVKIWYYNGSSWSTILYDSACNFNKATGNYSAVFTINSSSETQYIRGQVTYGTLSGDDQCYTGTYGDNDDIAFTVVGGTVPQFSWVENIGWQVNATVPSELTGLQDLFINATYNGQTRNDTQTGAIDYGSTGTPDINYSVVVNGGILRFLNCSPDWENADSRPSGQTSAIAAINATNNGTISGNFTMNLTGALNTGWTIFASNDSLVNNLTLSTSAQTIWSNVSAGETKQIWLKANCSFISSNPGQSIDIWAV